MSNYGVLAEWYEYLMKDLNYSSWAEYVCKRVKEYSFGKCGLDAFCGTGIITKALKKSGFSVTGADYSKEMLSKAVEKSSGILYVRQNMLKLKGFSDLDFITAINDGLGYIEKDKLSIVLNNFYLALKKGGLLMFDVSTPYRLKKVMDGQIYSVDDEKAGITYVWFNKYKTDKLVMDLTFFVKDKIKYDRFDEQHILFSYNVDEIISALDSAGFDLIKVEGELGSDLTEKSERANFLARRR